MGKSKVFLQSYNGNYSKWYNDVTLIEKLGQAKNLSCGSIDDMITLYEIGHRFSQSENHQISMFGLTIMSYSNDMIALEIRLSKKFEHKTKVINKHYKVSRA